MSVIEDFSQESVTFFKIGKKRSKNDCEVEKTEEQELSNQKQQTVLPTTKTNKHDCTETKEDKALRKILRNEPMLPPYDGKALFVIDYEGDDPLDEAWDLLSSKRQRKYEKRAEALKQEHIVEYEHFLNSMTLDMLQKYAAYQKEQKRKKKRD